MRGLVTSDAFCRPSLSPSSMLDVSKLLVRPFSMPSLARAVRVATELDARTTVCSIDRVGAYAGRRPTRSSGHRALSREATAARRLACATLALNQPPAWLGEDRAARWRLAGAGRRPGLRVGPALCAPLAARAGGQVHSLLLPSATFARCGAHLPGAHGRSEWPCSMPVAVDVAAFTEASSSHAMTLAICIPASPGPFFFKINWVQAARQGRKAASKRASGPQEKKTGNKTTSLSRRFYVEAATVIIFPTGACT